MKWIRNLNIGARVGLGFALVIAATVTVIAVGAARLVLVGDQAERIVTKDWVKAKSAASVEALTRENARKTMALFFAKDDAQMDAILRAIDDNKRTITQSLQTLDRLVYTDEGKALLARLKEARAAYVASFSQVAGLLRDGHREEATARLTSETLPALDTLQQRVAEVSALQQRLVDEGGAVIQREIASTRTTMIALGVAGMLAGSWFAWWLARSISRPIRDAVSVAETVAAGNLTARVSVNSRDETGQLLAALKKMNDSLVGIVRQVRNSSDSIATGSAQIATGNADLSQRTEEQASNLQQTAASMEQLTATVKQNADTARQAAQLAGGASAAATQGGEVMSQVVSTMEDISDSSRRIADIIGVIDGIAFQTNILALNAAVEAARAGEQGRGFAVVAGEVRTLAQRSATAAKEIKDLIGASVEKVETGSRLVHSAGESMDEIVAQVKRVNDLISEISAASVEQSSGIGQIGDAVSQLDQVTQQNAALVEESAAAAESLKQQAAHLARTVAVFQLAAAA